MPEHNAGELPHRSHPGTVEFKVRWELEGEQFLFLNVKAARVLDGDELRALGMVVDGLTNLAITPDDDDDQEVDDGLGP